MEDLDLLARLAVAVAVGAAVGFERETRNHAAGIRTHALVALGAALFTVAGAYGFGDIARGPNVDPARIAAQVASGIGFIGAGAIIRNGTSVRGVTTAATLWLAAALGLAAGAGLILLVVGAAVLVLVALVGLRLLGRLAARVGAGVAALEVVYERGHGTIGPVIRALEDARLEVGSIRVEDDEDGASAGGERTIRVEVTEPSSDAARRIADEIARRAEVRRVRWRRQAA